MSILDIKNLSHIYDSKPLFDKADLSVNFGEHIGVVGLNGAGKTTFINIIAKKLNQDDGEVKWNPGLRIGYLDQHADIDRSLSVMDYLKSSFNDLFKLNEEMERLYGEMDGLDGDELEQKINKANRILERLTDSEFFELDAKIKKAAGGLGIHNFGYDTLISTLSGGQRAKLMLCKLLLEEPDVMLLDEPTNFLDIEHIEWLVQFLNAYKKTFMVISHDTAFLDRITKFIVSIENAQIRKYSGNYSQFLVQAEENRKQYEDSYSRQQKEIERMEDYIARNKARAATAGMANARKKQLNRMDVLKKPTVIYDAEFSFPDEPVHTNNMLVVKDLSIGYSKPLLPPINFEMKGDTKLWIRGTNGIGKSTLIKTLTGELKPLGGTFLFHPATAIGYLKQDFSILNSDQNAVGYFSDLFPRLNIKIVRATLSNAGIKNELATKPVCDLSGGEQVRIFLCSLGQKTTNFLLLDEPTNHLDVRAKEALKKALSNYNGAIILVSHEIEFAQEICKEILDIKG